MNAALETPDRSEVDAGSGAVRTRPTPVGRSVLAVVAAGLVLLAGRLLAGAVTPIEITFEGVARLLGVPWVFNLVHALPGDLDRLAKPVLFALVLIGWAAIAWGLARRARPWAARLGRGPLIAAGVGLSVALPGLVLLPAQGLGVFGLSPANLAWDPLRLHLVAAAAGFVWAALAVGGSAPRSALAGRRDVVALLLRGTVATWAVATLGGRWLSARAQELADLFGRVAGLSPRITPTEDHYQISKNLFPPSVRERNWTLRLVGQVERELELTLADLRALPSVTRPSTLMCVSNTVGGDLVGTSEWTGVRLADLLEAAGVRPGANELVLRAADNYSDSFPLEDALREGTIVAYLQNGEPLTAAHGFPARVLVPGIYGMKNVKWVQEIELTDEDHLGYWQVRGWSDVATVKTMSRIDTDRATRLDDGRVAVGGIAYAGLRGVAAVEVSLDEGATWIPARVEPAPNELSWVRWVAVLETDAARFDLRVRAIEPDGTVQTDERTRPLPDGADGHHQVRIDVPG